jgi:ribonucleoside-diphosphate reductase alpha chain
VTSNGFVRGRFGSIGVVRGGAQPKMMEEHAPHMVHEVLEVERELSATMVDLSDIRAEVMEAAGNPVGDLMAAVGTALIQRTEAAIERAGKTRDLQARRAAEARMKGYEGDACGSCGNFTLVRNGTCMKCNTCGSTSGCS